MMETEVWPNLVNAAAKFNVPIFLVNARMSEKSLKQALRWPSLMCPAFNGLNAVFAQTKEDEKRLSKLGAKVWGVFGNLKFDAKPDPTQMLLAQHWRSNLHRPVIMLASSREGEEFLWLTAWQNYRQKNPQVLLDWLIVPRHPQRVAEVEELIQSQGLSVSRRSTWGEMGPAAIESPATDANSSRIFLGDSLGEMSLYYSFAQVALLGGSFENLGGQNLIRSSRVRLSCGDGASYV
jgi:3-deoxy-D-manno-octulosonic-acid transferase